MSRRRHHRFFSLSLSVTPEDGETTVLGKKVSELQTGIVISNDGISGTLKYVTGYTEFNTAKPEEQEGNYLALRFEDEPNAVTTVELVGGTKGPVTLDDDMNIVLRIKNKDTQLVKVVSKKGNQSVTKTYNLNGLILTEKTVE